MSDIPTRCETCKFAGRFWLDFDSAYTHCRARAPSKDGYPRVEYDHWCGQWTEAEDADPDLVDNMRTREKLDREERDKEYAEARRRLEVWEEIHAEEDKLARKRSIARMREMGFTVKFGTFGDVTVIKDENGGGK